MSNSIERSFTFITHFRLTKCSNNTVYLCVYYVSVFVCVAASLLAARKIPMRPAVAHLISIIMKTKVKTKRKKNTKYIQNRKLRANESATGEKEMQCPTG